jgi:hypothetical protein
LELCCRSIDIAPPEIVISTLGDVIYGTNAPLYTMVQWSFREVQYYPWTLIHLSGAAPQSSQSTLIREYMSVVIV